MRANPTPHQSVEIDASEVKYWKSKIEASKKRQKVEFKERTGYELNVRYYEGMQVAEGMKLNQLAIVDDYSPAITSIITTTYNRNPDVTAKALRPESDAPVQPSMMYVIQNPDFQPFSLSELMQSATKYGMGKVGMKEQMQLADFDLLTAGFACVEMNHLSEEAGDPANSDSATPQDASQSGILDKIGTALGGVVDKIKETLTGEQAADKIASEVQDEKVDFTDATYCKRWNPLDILFDDEAVVFSDSTYIAKIVRMSVAKFNTKYPKFKGKISATSEATQTIPYSSYASMDNKKAVTLYQLEIKKKSGRNCVLVLADGIAEEIDYYEDPVITNGFKIKYQALDKYGRIYPIPRATKARKPQDDMNHYMTIQFEHIDRAMRKIAVNMSGLTESGKAAQRSSDVYAIVEKNGPQPVYEAMPAPSVVPENKEVIAVMRDSLNKAFQTSELAKSGKSDNEFATQDVIEQKTGEQNSSAVTDVLEDLANELLDTLKDIIMQLWDGEDYFQVTGIKGGDQWYTPEMGPLADILVGDFLIVADITTAAKPNPMKDRQDSLEYAGFMTSPQTMQFAMMHGKRPAMSVLNNVVKQFNQNPDTAFEDLEPMLPPPGAVPVLGQQPQGKPVPENIPQPVGAIG